MTVAAVAVALGMNHALTAYTDAMNRSFLRTTESRTVVATLLNRSVLLENELGTLSFIPDSQSIFEDVTCGISWVGPYCSFGMRVGGRQQGPREFVVGAMKKKVQTSHLQPVVIATVTARLTATRIATLTVALTAMMAAVVDRISRHL